MNRRNWIIIAIIVVAAIIVAFFVGKYFFNGVSEDGTSDNANDGEEYCNIEWHDDVYQADGWEIKNETEKEISFSPEKEMPDVGEYIITKDKLKASPKMPMVP